MAKAAASRQVGTRVHILSSYGRGRASSPPRHQLCSPLLEIMVAAGTLKGKQASALGQSPAFIQGDWRCFPLFFTSSCIQQSKDCSHWQPPVLCTAPCRDSPAAASSVRQPRAAPARCRQQHSPRSPAKLGSGHSSSKLVYSLTKAHYVPRAAPEKH